MDDFKAQVIEWAQKIEDEKKVIEEKKRKLEEEKAEKLKASIAPKPEEQLAYLTIIIEIVLEIL